MEPPNSLTFGKLLNGFFDCITNTVQNAIQQAEGSQIEAQIESGKEIGLAIENTKNAFKDQLENTMSKVSEAAKNAFERISSMVEKFQENGPDLKELPKQAQQLLNTLPFAKAQPQLNSVKQPYIVIDHLAKESLVTFGGNFVDSSKIGFKPTLSFEGHQCLLVDSTNQSLTFQIPSYIFDKVDERQYSYKIGKLLVPWDNGWVLSNKTESEFQVALGALPPCAGTGYIEYVSKKMQDNAQTSDVQEMDCQENVSSETFQINWNDSILFEPQENASISRLVFEDYKGIHQEYDAPKSKGILKIENQNGCWRIWAEPPHDLQISPEDLSEKFIKKIKQIYSNQHLLNVRNFPNEFKKFDGMLRLKQREEAEEAEFTKMDKSVNY